jgi:predicted nucleotidyltransferase
MTLRPREKKAIELFKARLIESLPGEKPELLLFGSKARGDDRRGSDIDLLVLLKNDDLDVIREVYRTVTDVALTTSVYNMSLKPMSRKRFSIMKRGRTPFVCSVVEDAVTI